MEEQYVSSQTASREGIKGKQNNLNIGEGFVAAVIFCVGHLLQWDYQLGITGRHNVASSKSVIDGMLLSSLRQRKGGVGLSAVAVNAYELI